MGDEARIRSFLAAVRRRLRVRQLAGEAALVLGLAAGGLSMLLLVAAGAQPGPVWRVAFTVASLVGAAALVTAVGRALRRWRRDEPVARLVGERTGEGDFLLSAVELGRELAGPEARPLLGSPELARAHLAEAARRLSRTPPHQVAPWLPPPRRLVVAGAIALVWLAMLVGVRQRLVRGFAMLRGSGASPAARSTEPLVGDIELRLTFPAHTALPPRIIPGSSGDVLAPPGTAVVVRARPLVAIKSARLQVEDGAGKVLDDRAATWRGGVIEARFVVGATGGGYRFVLERGALQAKGIPRALREPEAHRIEIDADHPPKVTLAAPADELDIDGPRPVELAWSAEDDYGLGDVDLVWEGPGGGTPAAAARRGGGSPAAGASESKDEAKDAPASGGRGRITLRKTEPGSKGASGRFEWDIGELGLTPGVRITYHVEARDNDDVSGPNVGSSRTYALRIYSPAERHDELIAAEQALVDHALDLLGDRLAAGRGPHEGEALVRALQGAHTRTEDLLAELARLRVIVDKDPLAPRDLKPALAGIGARIGRLQQAEKAPFEALARAPEGEAERGAARTQSGRHATELEKDILLLDDLIGRQRIEQLLAVTDQMQQARDRLRSLLAEYKRTRSDAVKHEIEREIRALEQKLAELSQKASRLAGEVPDEYVNRQALGENDLQKRLDAIRDLVARGEIDKAMEEMRRLSSSLDKLAGSLEGDLKDFRGDRFSADEKALAELESKLSDLEHDERDIQQETDRVRDHQREEARRIGRERIEPFLKRAREKVGEIKRRLASVERNEIPPGEQEDIDRIKRRVEELGTALEHGDLEQAGEAARNSSDLMRGLSVMLRDEEERRWTGARAGLKRARDRLDEAEPMARQIADELDQLMPRPGEMLGEGERRKLDSLAERQEALRQRTEELRRELEKRGQGQGQKGGGDKGPQQPGTAGAAGEGPEGAGGAPAGLKAAGEHMGRAGDALHAGNPRDSVGEEGQAAEQLAKMRRDIQNERRPRNEGGGGSMASKEPVRIPGADEFRAPREFRQDLLEAMKREAPRQYREQVKRYYEELVK